MAPRIPKIPTVRVVRASQLRTRAFLGRVAVGIRRELPWVVAIAVAMSGLGAVGLVVSELGALTVSPLSVENHTGTLSVLEASGSSARHTICRTWTLYAENEDQESIGHFGASGRACFFSDTFARGVVGGIAYDEWCTKEAPCVCGGERVYNVSIEDLWPSSKAPLLTTFDRLKDQRERSERQPAEEPLVQAPLL